MTLDRCRNYAYNFRKRASKNRSAEGPYVIETEGAAHALGGKALCGKATALARKAQTENHEAEILKYEL